MAWVSAVTASSYLPSLKARPGHTYGLLPLQGY